MEKARPMSGPLKAMNAGHSNPSSKESMVPETAPMAKSTAAGRIQRRAMSCQVSSPVFSATPSAIISISGSPMPIVA